MLLVSAAATVVMADRVVVQWAIAELGDQERLAHPDKVTQVEKTPLLHMGAEAVAEHLR